VDADETENEAEFNFDWDSAPFTPSTPLASPGGSSFEDWEERYSEDTTGYVPDPLTTSFTDMDLRPALLKLSQTPEWAEHDPWAE
jgi:hypothetical protein